MEVSKLNQKVSAFLESGILRFEDSDSVFIDPVRVLNQLYTRFMVSPSSYYSRFFESSDETHQQSSNSRKRKRKEKKPYTLNERERAADWRHQEAKPFLLKASESRQIATDLLGVKLLFNFIRKTSEMKLELRTIVASISLWLTTTGEWKCPPEVEVKADGSLINELGLFHHSPCKCIILGQCLGEVVDSNNRLRIKTVPDNRIVCSVPGDYSRKPPIEGLLKEYSSGHGPTRCLKLFAREMVSGSVS